MFEYFLEFDFLFYRTSKTNQPSTSNNNFSADVSISLENCSCDLYLNEDTGNGYPNGTFYTKLITSKCNLIRFRIVSKKLIMVVKKNFRISQISKAVVQKCSVKKVFLKISQNSQENTCARVSFLIKL